MTEVGIPKTSFCMHGGHYEYFVIPFGIFNDPSIFQSLMRNNFRPFLDHFILVFFVDILIHNLTW